MNAFKNAWATLGSTALFVLLWSAGAIFTKWGLEHASAFAFLVMRFALALAVLLVVGIARRQWLPEKGTRWQVASAGCLMVGCYTINFFLALEHGVNPGILATVLGIQPILTLVLLERRFPLSRMAGLVLALGGLALVVYQSLAHADVRQSGTLYALGALVSITMGSILQKRIHQRPEQVLPMQYTISLVMCLICVPFRPFHFEWSIGFAIPLIYMGLVISVVAQLLLYRLIRGGNLVNVTSLFYLVPIVTAVLDYLVLGNTLPVLSLAGMGAILAGLALVFAKVSTPRTA
ncbi:EamA-like transporter family protein [Pararobbsia alpina]|uniref:DMT family transporter n=1 Tax=Pararobbsia alpina TaxID=621374 RepID=UPI0039A47888